MDMYTPANTILPKDLDRNCNMLTQLLDAALLPPDTPVLELFGGVGGFSRIIRQRFHASHVMYEKDPTCCALLTQAGFGEQLIQSDSVEGLRLGLVDIPPGALVIADWNVMTILKARSNKFKAVWEAILNSKAARVFSTDVAITKLHLNAPYYGMTTKGLSEYVHIVWGEFLRPYGWKPERYATHTRATMMDFYRSA